MANIIVIGNGPAGISAALYAARAGMETTIIGNGAGALAKAEKIENYYGFAEPVSGTELLENGLNQVRRLGVTMLAEEVVGLGYEEKLTVKTNLGKYDADSVIIATGTSRATPRIQGLSNFEGSGVSFCAVCDAFFYRGKNVAVLGYSEYALNEVEELLPVVGSVTLLTNGESPVGNFPEKVRILTSPVTALEGEGRLERAVLADGTTLSIDGLFVAYGTAGSADLARKLGVMTNGNKIVVDENMATNIPGLYAAGDCTGGMLQIAKAVYQGAQAGTSAVKYLRGLGLK